MYNVALMALFAALATYAPHRRVWLAVCAVTASVVLARLAYGHNDAELYVIRSTAALLGGLFLCRIGTKLALYHASVYACTLGAYVALAVDVSAGRHILIYNNFEAVIYGLVACQLIGVCPTIRACLVPRRSTGPFSLGHNQRAIKK